MAATALLALAVGGCAVLGFGAPPVPAFNLTPTAAPVGPIRGQLVVPEPTALALLDSERVIVGLTSGQVATLAGVQWSDRLPRLMQASIVQTFENSARIRAVGKPGDRIAADHQLLIDVRRFQLSVTPEPVGEVEIAARIVAEQTGRIVAGRVFRASVPAAGSEGPAAVAAIEAAFHHAAGQLVRWTGRVLAPSLPTS